jgi:broad specificity phosphatase PhoE
MTEILLVRHAHHDRLDSILCGRMAGVGLSATGVSASRRLAAALAGEDVAAIYSSPRDRARETGAAIAESFSLPVVIAEGLDEVDFGDWSGQSFAALAADPAWTAWNRHRQRARAPGGESMKEAQARAVAEIGRIAALHGEAKVVAVSHAEIIRALILHWLGLALDAWPRLAVLPAALSRVRLGRGEAVLLSLNEGAP